MQQTGVQETEVKTAEGHKIFYTAADIASDLSISEEEAEGLVKELHKELKASGSLVVSGKVPAAWYGQQKENGFMGAMQQGHIPLTDKRLLKLDEFCCYSGMGQKTARKFAKAAGIEKRIGRRVLFDRALFDEWCSNNKSIEL